ncbi:MAG: hypothetical protein ACM3WU_09275 [Bacillota bacterium]
MPRRLCVFLFVACVLLALASVSCSNNTKPPSYIKELVTYEEGDGLIVYFILADENGEMTGCDGAATIKITQEYTDWVGWDLVERTVTVYEKSRTVEAGDFKKATAGLGAFEHDIYAYFWGRVAKSDMKGLVDDTLPSGEVQLVFAPTKPLAGKEKLVLKESCFLPD